MLCIMCVLCSFFELISSGWHNADEYNEVIEEYSGLSYEECYAEIEAAREEYDVFWDAYTLYFGEFVNSKHEKQVRKSLEGKLGPDYESIIAGMDFSEERQHRLSKINNALGKLESQLEYLDSFPKYLDTVHENSAKGSLNIFAKNIYNKRNSIKTDEDYPKSDEIVVKLTTIESFDNFICGKFDSYCALILVIAIVLKFADEKKKGLWSLVYGCKKGRGKLAFKRVIVLLVGAVIGTFLISLCRLISCISEYGSLPDLSYAVQSSQLFKHFVYPLSFGQVLVLSFILKITGTFLVGLFFWLLMQGIRNYKFALIVSAIVLVAEYICLYRIPDSFTLVPLRFANVLAPLDLEHIFLKYLNINIFGYPVTGTVITLAFAAVFMLAVSAVIILMSHFQKPVKPAGATPRIFKKIECAFVRLRASAGLSGVEIRKSFVFQRGMIIIAVLFLTVYYLGSAPYSDTTMYDKEVATDAGAYSCEISEEVLDDIDSQIAELKRLPESVSKYQTIKALEAFKADAQSKFDENRGIWLLNQAPYASLFGKGVYQRKWGTIAFAFTVLLCAGLFSFEKQSRMTSLLMTTVRGRRKSAVRKIILALLSAVFVWAVMSATEIYETYEYFGNFADTLRAPLISIDYFRESTTTLTIGQYAVIYYLLKLLCLSAVALTCCAISLKVENVNKAVVSSSVLLLTPGLLSVLDVPLVEYASFIRLWSPVEAHNVSFIFCFAFIPVLVIFIIREWERVKV